MRSGFHDPPSPTHSTLDPEKSAQAWRWGVVSPTGLRWSPWETDTHLFNPETGETHLINELPAETLRMLSDRPWDFGELCEGLADRCDIACDDAWQGRVHDMLLELEALELIERRPADAS